jgi:hypothetical protein
MQPHALQSSVSPSLFRFVIAFSEDHLFELIEFVRTNSAKIAE